MKRTAFVTGGGQGIGRGIVETLIAQGWRVLALDRDKDALRELAGAYPADSLLTIGADVASERGIASAFDRLDKWQKRHGDAVGLDLLVNNAGIADPHCGPIEKLSLAKWRTWIDSHLTGAFLCTRAAVPRLRKREGASIVNMASTRAFQSEPDTEAYAASKGALVAFTHALAISEGPAIRANAICPGWIETAQYKKAAERSDPKHRKIDNTQHPAGRIGTPDDIAQAVLYLADARFVTGQTLIVDGGMTRKMIYAE